MAELRFLAAAAAAGAEPQAARDWPRWRKKLLVLSQAGGGRPQAR